jgi:hypothetical protein
MVYFIDNSNAKTDYESNLKKEFLPSQCQHTKHTVMDVLVRR